MLGAVDLRPHLGSGAGRVNWVICGGESGPRARGTDAMIGWYRDLRDQCAGAGVPFFFKQWGNFSQAGDALVQLRAKNKVAELDGRTWRQWPGLKDAFSVPTQPPSRTVWELLRGENWI